MNGSGSLNARAWNIVNSQRLKCKQTYPLSKNAAKALCVLKPNCSLRACHSSDADPMSILYLVAFFLFILDFLSSSVRYFLGRPTFTEAISRAICWRHVTRNASHCHVTIWIFMSLFGGGFKLFSIVCHMSAFHRMDVK